jgi:Dyp-type peroxidase family
MTALELQDIQGNVLRGYGFPHAGHLAVRVLDGASGRRLIRDLLPGVTAATPWVGIKPPTTLNVAVSYAGLCALEVDGEHLRSFAPEFRQGMQARAEQQLLDTGSSHPATWEDGLRAGDIHVLVSVHARTRTDLHERLDIVREHLARNPEGLEAQPAQYTHALLIDGARREHFGYADGIGQPAIAGVAGGGHPGQGVPTERGWRLARRGPIALPHPAPAGWRPVKAGEFVLGYHDEDGVLPAAPAAPLGRNGTFMVYRKLEQDVPAFRALVASLAKRSYSGDQELAKAKIVGRWTDGTPLALSPDHADGDVAGDPARVNDFRFDDDARGHGCPLGAHIRRANPRASLSGKGQRTRRHRILRRGMPYGPWLEDDARDAGSPRGLLFICFQASIARQFEVVNRWCAQGSSIGLEQDRDYLTAAADGDRVGMTVQGNPPVFLEPHGPLVTTRGGEYLFLPGLAALAAIAGERRMAAAPARRPEPVGAREAE